KQIEVQRGDLLVLRAVNENVYEAEIDGQGAGRVNMADVLPLADAVGLFDELLRNQGDDAVYLYRRGLAHNAGGNRQQAIADFQSAIRLDAKYAEAHCKLG